MGREIAKILNVEYNESILVKIKDNKAQSELNKEDRKKNVQNVYKINDYNKQIIVGKKILLIDDIFTTGNTADECAKILKKANAKNVGVFSIARD